MAQVKKEAVRSRILEAASRLFEEKGYVGATMGQISARARLSTANIYVYFPSKLDIAFAIFTPWIEERIAQTEIEAASIRNPRKRLAHVLARIWRDIPYERNSYFNNFIQAIAVSTMNDGYTPKILLTMRDRVGSMIASCLPEERRDQLDLESIAHLAVMAFDGFVINGHLDPTTSCTDNVIDAVCALILGRPETDANDPPRTARSKPARAKLRTE
jgi:AcrR family transcriptional regulator